MTGAKSGTLLEPWGGLQEEAPAAVSSPEYSAPLPPIYS